MDFSIATPMALALIAGSIAKTGVDITRLADTGSLWPKWVWPLIAFIYAFVAATLIVAANSIPFELQVWAVIGLSAVLGTGAAVLTTEMQRRVS